ncbi:MAG: hypothetical protein V2J89_12445 [Halieaceae bacterium]|nr:hypothetical protein [Halieaceae bacterium]
MTLTKVNNYLFPCYPRRAEALPTRSGMSIEGFPAVMIGVAVLAFGTYILYVCFFDDDS